MRQIEKELADICLDILSILDNHLIPFTSSGESKVFYFKMFEIFLIQCNSISLIDFFNMN